ncbi:MAG: hypothetical protein JWQ49_195 [Edaphobacter sp.]|nr:hypothetical protein [Edaphobacter sp.]
MDAKAELSAPSWLHQMDFFRSESENFQRDLYIIILGSYEAGVKALAEETTAYAEKLEAQIKEAKGDYQEHLIDRYGEAHMDNAGQERFLRNMAFVAIATRLIHAMRNMMRTAENFCPRKKKYGNGSMSEILRLWSEVGERFGIDVEANANKIAFAIPLNDVRNQIVHDGGDANPPLSFEKCTLEGGDADYLDLSFSTKYPEYVDGTGSMAEVKVTKEQFDKVFDASIARVKFLAAELRKREMAYVKQSKTI